MTETECSLVYWALELAKAYHDGRVGNDLHEIDQIVGFAERLSQERQINLAYLSDQYASAPAAQPDNPQIGLDFAPGHSLIVGGSIMAGPSAIRWNPERVYCPFCDAHHLPPVCDNREPTVYA